jgi:hypothetical protein
MRKVRINRTKWRSGGEGLKASGKGETELYNKEGFSCCLGFASHQLAKCNKDKLKGESFPCFLDKVITPLTERDRFNYVVDTDFTTECVAINDDEIITRKQREAKLKRKFKANDLELEFYGEYTDYNDDEF